MSELVAGREVDLEQCRQKDAINWGVSMQAAAESSAREAARLREQLRPLQEAAKLLVHYDEFCDGCTSDYSCQGECNERFNLKRAAITAAKTGLEGEAAVKVYREAMLPAGPRVCK